MLHAQGSKVVVTVTGTVQSGYNGGDTNGPGPGTVFGAAWDLTGQPYTLTMTFDPSEGTGFFDYCSDGTISQSGASGTAAPPAPTAVLQIGGGSYSFGTLALQSLSWHIYRGASCLGFNEVAFGWDELYSGNYEGRASFGNVALYPTGPNFTSGDWRTSVPTAPVPPTYFQFSIHLYNSAVGPDGQLTTLAAASGYLWATGVSVSGVEPLQITTTSLPPASTTYRQALAATGGSGTGYMWSLSSGALPPGFTLSPGGVINYAGNPTFAPARAYNFVAEVTDSAGSVATQPFSIVVQCPAPVMPSLALAPQYMWATFTPSTTPVSTIFAYASACGFKRLNWQQQITTDPATEKSIIPNVPSNVPNNVYPASCSMTDPSGWPPNCALAAGRHQNTNLADDYPPYSDPPDGGYTYSNSDSGMAYDPFPFYYLSPAVDSPGTCTVRNPLGPPSDPNLRCAAGLYPYVVSPDSTTLSFLDLPAHPGLKGVSAATDPPPGTFVAFATSLVGVSTDVAPGSVSCGGNSLLYCTTLYSWTWNSTFNGHVGGASCSPAPCGQSQGIYPVDPSSGTGGVTITSINGIQLPPAVSSSQISVKTSGLAYSRVSQAFNGTVTLNNIGSNQINGPLQIVFFGIPGNVTLLNATANLSGSPYLTVPAAAGLAPGQSISVSVQFKNPSNATINLSPVVYSGSIN